jgi:hypothetical protein
MYLKGFIMTNRRIREILESPVEQGTDENITYNLNTAPWGGSPDSVDSVDVFLIENGGFTDVTDDVCTSTAEINDDIITLPAISGLDAGKTYRVEVLYTSGASQLEAWGLIYCTR